MRWMSASFPLSRTCLRDPIPEIFEAAQHLDAAATAHLRGDRRSAEELIRSADIPAISAWSESLWGAGGPWSQPATSCSQSVALRRETRSGRGKDAWPDADPPAAGSGRLPLPLLWDPARTE